MRTQLTNPQKIHPKELGVIHMPTHLSRFHPKYLLLDETLFHYNIPSSNLFFCGYEVIMV
jgi:hypothetical protein